MTKNEALFRAQVQIAGEALRISARVLQAAIKRESQIYLPLFDHTHILSEQIAQAAVCNHFHTTDQRLACWLLLARDRIRNGAFNLTYEAMAQILGVSRSGVSLAAGALQMKGLIRYARGRITDHHLMSGICRKRYPTHHLLIILLVVFWNPRVLVVCGARQSE